MEKAPFLNINDINDISFLGTPGCHQLFYSVSGNANSMVSVVNWVLSGLDK
jgi:hypothetical protein